MSSLREKYFGNSKVSSNTNISTTSRLRQKYGLDTQKDKEKWHEEYFSKGAFEDGYQFGDVTKTVTSTVGDVTTNLLKGVTGIGDAFGKLGASVIAQVADWMGKDEYADKVRNRIAGKDEETNEKLAKYTPTGLLTKANEAISKDSVLEEKSDNIVNSVGYLGGQVALQSIGVPWQVTAGVNSAGNELSSAYANNAKDYEAWLSAGLNAGIEIGSEYLFSGVKLPGTGKASEELIGGLTEKIKNKGLKYSLELLTQVGGEGLEEVISGYGNALGQKLTYMSEKELNELYNSDQALEDFVSGALVSVLANGANPNTYNDIKTGKSLITGNTIDEAKVNSVINENLERKEINFKDLDDLQKQIALDKINSKINEYHVRQEQNKLTKEQQQQIAKLEKQLNVLQKEVDNQNNVDIKEKINMPTVNDIVAQEQKTSNVNLPSSKINSSKVNLPTVNDLIKSNVNANQSIIQSNMIQIKPQIIEEIKAFQNNNSIEESYSRNNVIEMMKAADIEVPTAFNYVTEVKPDMTYNTSNDLSQSQHNEIRNALSKLKNYDVTSINNINQVIMPADVSQIRQVKGNIPINQELLNKYSNVSELINNNLNKYDGKINVENNIAELSNIEINNMTQNELSNLAIKIFEKYNNSNVFVNDNNKIMVTRGGIKESINKILYNKNQKQYLKEHLQVFSDLGDIIESATLASQTTEGKSRENNKVWNYYLNGVNINGNSYLFEFDVVSRQNGENHYRVQRLEKINNKKADISVGNTNISVTPTLETSASYDNNITQSNENVKLPTINNMQNKEKNTINMPPVENKVQTEPIIEEPQKLANILKERPVTIEEKDNWLVKLLKIKLLDKGHYVNELSRKTKNRELASKYDYMLGANGIAQQIIGNERFNPKTQKSEGKGLHKIFEPIENSGKLQEFTEYMYHKHNVSRMSLNTLFQEENKPIFGDGITSETSKKIVEDFESKNPEFIKWAEEVYNYNNFLLDVLVDYGVIGKEDKSYYNNKYPYYVPTIRATDKTKTQMEFIGKKASVNTPIKKAKGGNQDIIPLKEAMALRTMQTMNSALRNNFGMELLNTIETEAESNKVNIDDVVGDDIDAEEFLTKSTKKAPATLTVFQNGEKITFDIADEIYEALAASQRYKIKALNNISKFRRALITEYNPAFMLTNPIKDVQDGALNSKHPSLFLKNIAEATKQISSKGDFYKLYLANGGSYETYFNYGEGYNKLPTKRGNLDPRKILDKISQINQSIEMTPRLAEFISSLESGESIETAMYNAQEITTNFKRGGDWTKNLDANGVTFLNAGVQGALKQVRNFREAKSQGIKGITNLAVKWSIAGITPYILSQLIWGDDDDYEELSDYVKNNYYILWKNADGTFVRIPKGRVMSVIQNLFKQPLDALKGEKIDVKEFVELLQNQVLPSNPTESNIFSPLLDVAQNKTWYGGDLVPQRLQSLPEEEQYDESTDSISIWLGQKLGISPIKINYILDQYSGAIGDMILPTLTLEAENDSNYFMSNLLAPMKDKFTTDSVMNNQNISDLYNLDDELTKRSKSSNATTDDILKSKYINSIQTEMNKLTAEKRNIQNDTTLTNNEKYKQVREIQKQINQLAKDGLNNYKDVEIYNNYAKVGDKEYYKNNSDEWQKLDTTTAKYKTANQITTYNKYLTYQKEIDTIKDKYENTNQRKNAVINYVNSLKLSIPQKAMLIKMNYSSFNSYNSQIIEYINNQDLSKSEKEEILTKLGFTVKDGRVYY